MSPQNVWSGWRSLALLLAGMLVGMVMIGVGSLVDTADAHVDSVSHLWSEHLKDKVKFFGDKRWVNHQERMWAVVEADGTLVRGERAVSVSYVGVGKYVVTFNRRVEQCAYEVTPATCCGFVVAGPWANNAKAVQVAMYTTALGGVPSDRSFNLVVHC